MAMNYTVSEILQFVKENDVKFIRLAFCDIFGRQKNISIMPDQLERAFQKGISFDASAVRGFLNVEESDLFLVPDPSTLSVLPWRPSHGRVVRLFCNIKRPDGSYFEGDGRRVLELAVERAAAMGYVCEAGAECEFYLFETDEKGDPLLIPHDRAGYCDIAPLDKGENVRREICLTLEQMGMKPESSHHEQGPGQNEIDFQHSGALETADNPIAFKAAVKSIAAGNGLYASFMPKPLPEESGSGLHMNLSLLKNGENIFKRGPAEHSAEAESFIAGVLSRVREITAFLNPLTNSYQRFGGFEAPRYVTWSHENRSQLVRIPAGDETSVRMELRSPDPACHPHLAFALLLHAGLDGIEKGAPLPAPVNRDLYREPPEGEVEELPRNLALALRLACDSELVRRIIPEKTLERYVSRKLDEWKAYAAAEDQAAFEQGLYFRKV